MPSYGLQCAAAAVLVMISSGTDEVVPTGTLMLWI